jgi:methanethiol S-methyltransferase
MKIVGSMHRELVPPAQRIVPNRRSAGEGADSPSPRTGVTSRWEEVRAYAVAAVTGIIGLGSLALFVLFVATGGLAIIDMKMGWRSVLVWDAVLCLAFFFQHSGMVRRPFRDWLGKAIPAYWHGAFYTVTSGAALVLLSVCWQPSHVNIFRLEGAVRWLIQGLSLLSCIGIAWCFRALGDFDAFGTQSILSHLRRERPHPAPFTIRGPYRWVRHPVYFFGIVVFWACPSLSLDRMLFDILFTVWIAIGAVLEERDLVAEFGDTYRDYQRKVPMLLPWRLAPGW